MTESETHWFRADSRDEKVCSHMLKIGWRCGSPPEHPIHHRPAGQHD